MKTTFGRMILLVEDYDAAFEFYQKNFSCEKIYDAEAPGGQRYLHARFSSDDQAGIWFLKADSPGQHLLVGKQTGGQPTLVIYTNDCRALYEHVKSNQVKIIEPIAAMHDSIFFHCADLFGNRIVVVELKNL